MRFLVCVSDYFQSTETWTPLVASQMTEPVGNAGGFDNGRNTTPSQCDAACFAMPFAAAPPNSLNVSPPGGGGVPSSHRKRRTLIAPELNLSLDQSEGSLLSDDFLDTPDDLDINVDDIDTPDETDSLEFITNGNELEWEGEIKGRIQRGCEVVGSVPSRVC